MTTVFLVVALLGVILVAVGGVLYLFQRPATPTAIMLMVIGAVVYAVAQIFIIFDALF
jgi:drug/metabolite transporter (DMT)-like permease